MVQGGEIRGVKWRSQNLVLGESCSTESWERKHKVERRGAGGGDMSSDTCADKEESCLKASKRELRSPQALCLPHSAGNRVNSISPIGIPWGHWLQGSYLGIENNFL